MSRFKRLLRALQILLIAALHIVFAPAFQDEPKRARIHELFGDSITFDYAPYLGQHDVVLVDAGHKYDHVKSDTQNALRLLSAEGGVIIWHDFPNAPGVCLVGRTQRQTGHLSYRRPKFGIHSFWDAVSMWQLAA